MVISKAHVLARPVSKVKEGNIIGSGTNVPVYDIEATTGGVLSCHIDGVPPSYWWFGH